MVSDACKRDTLLGVFPGPSQGIPTRHQLGDELQTDLRTDSTHQALRTPGYRVAALTVHVIHAVGSVL